MKSLILLTLSLVLLPVSSPSEPDRESERGGGYTVEITLRDGQVIRQARVHHTGNNWYATDSPRRDGLFFTTDKGAQFKVACQLIESITPGAPHGVLRTTDGSVIHFDSLLGWDQNGKLFGGFWAVSPALQESRVLIADVVSLAFSGQDLSHCPQCARPVWSSSWKVCPYDGIAL